MSSEQYQPYHPLNVLKPIGPDIWIVDGAVLNWTIGGVSLPFPTRMTLVRLPDGGLWVHSPVAPDEDLLRAVDNLGPVRHLVSSNKIHHVSIGPWAQRYPDAKIWASPGVRKRSNVNFSDDLEDLPPADWSEVIDQRIARGSKALVEVVFFHPSSRTLILTDLIENFEADRVGKGFFLKILMRMGGVMAPRAGMPRDIKLSFIGGHKKLAPVVRWMLESDPKQVIISHGKWFENNGREIIARAFSWVKGVS